MLLEVLNVSFRYPEGVEVLRDASFSVDRGETVAIIGPNGCGKTTLLMISAGLLKPDKGLVLLEGSSLMSQLPEARRRIGFLFQNPDDQIFNPTVYDEIAFALRQILSSEDEVDKRVYEVSEKLGIKSLLKRPPHRLSLGEKRKVTLASILAYDPDILLLDEPTANLSAKFIDEVERVMVEAVKEGKAVVVTSHDVEFVARIADRVYVLSEGCTLGGTSKYEVLTDASLLKLAEMNPPFSLQVAMQLGLRVKEGSLTLRELIEAIKNEFEWKFQDK